VRIFYSSRYEIPLPGHIWPTTKYRLTAERIAGPAVQLVDPTEASWEDLGLVHTVEYLERVRSKAFIIATVLGPVLMGGLMVIPALVAGKGGKPLRLSILDDSGTLAAPSAADRLDG
jgi:hypothetical protein